MIYLSNEEMMFIQTIAIVISFLLSFYGSLKSSKQTKINNSLIIAQNHRELWLEFCRNDKFSRIFDKNVDFQAHPITMQEKQFVNLIYIHMSDSVLTTRKKLTYKIEGLEADLIDMLQYPIMLTVWNEYAPYHDKRFFTFVEGVKSKMLLQQKTKVKLKKISKKDSNTIRNKVRIIF